MAVAQKHRDPRAHWVLLLLACLVLFGELAFAGYIRHIGAEGSDPRTIKHPVPASDAVLQAGPVLSIDAQHRLSSSDVPADTIALTFDDGPDPVWTPKILDVLERHGAHATFFVIGSKVNEHPEIVRRMIADGNDVGIHTFTHRELITIPEWQRELEINLTQNALAGAAGINSLLMRPPYSSEPDALTSEEYLAISSTTAGRLFTVLTDLDTQDWARPGVPAIVQAATPPPGRGAVVMLHDGGGDREETVEALDELLTRLGDIGFKFTPISPAVGLSAGYVPAGPAERWRGAALRFAQTLATWVASVLQVLLFIALLLGLTRVVIQVIAARIHSRRARRVRAARTESFTGSVTVVVPAYNEAANIAATVRSLMANDYRPLEVIVVDDGSTDGTADIVRSLDLPGVRVVQQPNGGKPAALNAGIARATGEIIVLVDGDTVFEQSAITNLVQPFLDAKIGAVSGNAKVGNRRGLLGLWQHVEYVVGFNLDRRLYELGDCMPTVPGAIGAFRREVLRSIGGVPDDTLAEDTDLTMSVLRAGWRVVYEETAIAFTEAPSSLRQLWKQRYRWCYGTMQALWKHRASLRERGPAGKLGRRGLAYIVLFQVALPLTAPAVDIFTVYGLIFLPWQQVLAAWLGFTAVQLIAAGYALRLDKESIGPLWTMPLQLVAYRQIIYLVTVQSTVAALAGMRLRWQTVKRTGSADQLLAGSKTP